MTGNETKGLRKWKKLKNNFWKHCFSRRFGAK